MIAKRIEYSDHARGRLRLRGITRSQVRWLIARGARSTAPTLGGAQRWQSVGYLGRNEARVIYLEEADRYLIVMVEWIGERRNVL